MTKTIPAIAALAGALVLLAGCAQEFDQPPIPYRATTPLHEVGTSSFVVTSYSRVGGSTKALRGVPCVFEGAGFRSEFTTPAVVISPNMQARTPVASVTCTLDGERKVKIIQPFNETIAQINQGVTTGGGIVGILVGGAVAAAQTMSRDVSQDVYGYPDVAITFDGAAN